MLNKTLKISDRSHGLALWSRRFPALPAKESGQAAPKDLRHRRNAQPIAIMGVPFDNITTEETIQSIEEMIRSGQPHYLATANVDFLVQAMHDVELRRILIDAHLVLCDGTPLIWASKLLGNPLPERVAGSDLIPLLIKVASRKKYRIFFLGGTPDSTGRAILNLRNQYPELEIAGHYSPPFASLLEMNHDEIVFRIHQAKPDILLVSFGCPKQEKWIAMHYRTLGVPASVGVGATIDFLAGTVKRAPRWMQKSGTEWLYRMAQEPRRLFRRYVKDILWFGIGLSRQWTSMFISSHFQPRLKSSSVSALGAADFQIFKAPPRLDLEATHEISLTEAIKSQSMDCVLDVSGVEFIDSSGIGFLVRWQKCLRTSKRRLVLLAPSKSVENALRLMRLEDFFTIALNLEEARACLRQPLGTPAYVLSDKFSNSSVLQWVSEVTSANAPEVWQTTLQYLNSRKECRGEACVDLSLLKFIDSTGASLMLRTKKNAAQNGVPFRFIGMQPNVRNVLRISRLETFLTEKTQ